MRVGWGVVVAVLLLMGGVGVVSIQNITVLATTATWVTHTAQVLQTMEGLQVALAQAESASRGYLVTGDSLTLESYQLATRTIADQLRALRRLTADNATQQQRIDTLEPLVTAHSADLARTIETRRSKGFAAAVMQEEAWTGLPLIVQIQSIVTAMDYEERLMLRAREQQVQERAYVATLIVGFGSLLSIGLLGGATVIVRRSMRQRRQALLALRTSEDQLQTLVTNVPIILYTFNRSGTVTLATGKGLDLLHHTQHQVVGRSAAQVFQDGPLAQAAIARALAGHTASATIALHDHVFEVHYTPQYDPDAVVTSVIGIGTDVTERTRAEEALHAAQRKAERANDAKNAYLSRMSHELRTPLNAILGFAQVLEREDLTDEQCHDVGLIRTAGRHLLRLINDVLDISSIEAGRMEFSLEPVAVAGVLMETLDLLRQTATGRGISLAVDTVESHRMLADHQRITQVLLNLLSNAIKFNHDGGSVHLSCTPVDATRLRIAVMDTGPGIAQDKIPRLFVPFDRLDLEPRGIEGTGLGLSLSLGLVEAMGGTMGVTSQVGVGSTFWIELERVQGIVERSPEKFQVTVPPSPLRTPTSSTVLYIEDNLSNIALIEQLVRWRPGVRLLTAMHGGLGLELARDHQPDLILLDLHLPDRPGVEVLAQLRAEPRSRDIPVVILSADATPRQIERMLAGGASAYLTKPFDVTDVLTLLDDLLRPEVTR